MASALSHAVTALSLASCFYRPQIPKRVWVAGALCSVLPDLDVVGFRFGIRYSDFWGHRGFTHSLVFAALLACLATVILLQFRIPEIRRFPLVSYLFLATASHGVLDALTNGGLGVAFFSPFDNDRYFFPWRPVRVSPISIAGFFTSRGFAILQNEFLWIWLPSLLFAVLVLILRRVLRPEATEH